MNYALVNTANNIVENILVLEEGAAWAPPSGFIAVPIASPFGIGDSWDGTQFIKQKIIIVPAISKGVQNVIG